MKKRTTWIFIDWEVVWKLQRYWIQSSFPFVGSREQYSVFACYGPQFDSSSSSTSYRPSDAIYGWSPFRRVRTQLVVAAGMDSMVHGILPRFFRLVGPLNIGAFHEQGLRGGEKMTIFKSHFSHEILTQMAPLGPN